MESDTPLTGTSEQAEVVDLRFDPFWHPKIPKALEGMNLPALEQVIYFHLAMIAGSSSESAKVSLAQLQARSSLSKSSTIKAIKGLETRRLIRIKTRSYKNQAGKRVQLPNQYQLLPATTRKTMPQS